MASCPQVVENEVRCYDAGGSIRRAVLLLGCGEGCPTAPVTTWLNSSFEVPQNPTDNSVTVYPEEDVPGWEAAGTTIEIWRGTVGGVTAEVGEQVTEVDNAVGAIWQDFILPAAAGEYRWRFRHHHRPSTQANPNTVELRIGDSTVPPLTMPIIFTSTVNQGDPWLLREGVWSKPAGLTTVRLMIRNTFPNFGSAGNIIDDVDMQAHCPPGEGEGFTWVDSLTGAEVDPGLLVPCGSG